MADPEPSRAIHQAHIDRDGGYSSSLVYVPVEGKGGLEIEICDVCHLVNARCDHEINEWVISNPTMDNPYREKLLCKLCGIDGA